MLPSPSVPVQISSTFTPRVAARTTFQPSLGLPVPASELLQQDQCLALPSGQPSVLQYSQISRLFPRLSWLDLNMTYFLTLSGTMDEPFPISIPVLLDFALVSDFTFSACTMAALP